MSMEEGLDTGPVIEQESTSIKDSDNLEILTNRLSNISSKLLLRSLERIKLTKGLNKSSRLKQLNAIDQTKLGGSPSYARQITKEDNLIDWNQNARKIIKKIQGLYPNAYTFYNSKRIKILEVRISCDNNQSTESQDLKQRRRPGEIIMINRKIGLKIMTNDYPVLITYAQLEGKKATDSYTLSIQSNMSINSEFGF